jgi:hypothetical protein
VLLRIGQGLALGGSWDGLPSLLAVNAPPNRRGFYAMIPQLGAPVGVPVASALFAFIIANVRYIGGLHLTSVQTMARPRIAIERRDGSVGSSGGHDSRSAPHPKKLASGCKLLWAEAGVALLRTLATWVRRLGHFEFALTLIAGISASRAGGQCRNRE